MRINEVIRTIEQAVPGAPFPRTVDKLQVGDARQPVQAIVTTFMATYAVIAHAARLGANLIITHEPTFYQQPTWWLQDDPVYKAKMALLRQHQMAIWRFHDGWHMHRPDGIYTGLLKALDWEAYAEPRDDWLASPLARRLLKDAGLAAFADPSRAYLCTIPPMTLTALAALFRARLGSGPLRVAGPADLPCRRVALLPGSLPGILQTAMLGRNDVDLLVVGELNEWESCEYVRDAAYTGRAKGLIVLGHAHSEEPGMAWLAEWLQPRLPGVPVVHVPAGGPLHHE